MSKYRAVVEVMIPEHSITREVFVQADSKAEARRTAKEQACNVRLQSGYDKQTIPSKAVKAEVFLIPQPAKHEWVCDAHGAHRPHIWTPEARCPGRAFDLT